MPKYVVHVFVHVALLKKVGWQEEFPEKIPSGQPVEHDF